VSDKNLGGRDFDLRIAKYIAQKYDNLLSRSGNESVSNNRKFMTVLLNNAKRIKEQLTLNTSTTVNITSLDGRENLTLSLTRDTFDEITKEELNRVLTPLEKALKLANLTLNDISYVEALGGAFEVPAVHQVLKNRVGDKLIRNNYNFYESTALGAAFIAANYSAHFVMSKALEVPHGNSFDLIMKLRNVESKGQAYCEKEFKGIAENCTRKISFTAPLFKARSGIDISKSITLNHDGNFDILIYQRFPEDKENETHILTFKVRDIQESLYALRHDNITTKPKINLKFHLDKCGFVSLKVIIFVFNIILGRYFV